MFLLFRERAKGVADKQLNIPLDVSQRSAQLMGNVRDEIRFKLAELRDAQEGSLQLGRALLDAPFQRAVGCLERRTELDDLLRHRLVEVGAADQIQIDQ